MTIKQIVSIIIIIMNCILVSLQTFAQQEQELDKAIFKLYYEYTWQFDTLKLDDKREDLIILQVGESISKSYSYYTFQSDSLSAMPDGVKVRREAINIAVKEAMARGEKPKFSYIRRMSTKIYKNHPIGQMTVTDNINQNYYKYSDELHSQNWEMTDSTKTILDYPCQMAVSDFRGRRWTAWFAPDIPISDGPWKFSGLPGLIMEVYDTKKHFHFTIVGIEKVENEPIVFSPVVLSSGSYGKYEKATRIDFLKGLFSYHRNSSAFMNAEIGIAVFDESSPNRRHNDLIERDYK